MTLMAMETPRSKYTGGPSSPIKTSPLKNSTATPVFGYPTEHVPASPFASPTRPIYANYNYNAHISSNAGYANSLYTRNEPSENHSLANKTSFITATTPVAPSPVTRRAGFSHRHSPSMPDLGAMASAAADGAIASPVASPLDAFRSKHARSGSTNSNNSDVQGIVARFNRLDIRDRDRDRDQDRDNSFAASVNGNSNASMKDNRYITKDGTVEKPILEKPRAAREDILAIKRAELAREAAEAEARRSNEEVHRLREELQTAVAKVREEGRKHMKEVEDVRDRERRQYKRLEVIIEELNRTRKSSAQTIATHEKAVRTERKENFKLQSAFVKVQEETKAARASLRVARSALDAEKQKLDQREQETFSAQYKLIGTQEALTSTQERLKVLEAERDALKTSLKEEEVARVAAEGRIALPVPKRTRCGANGRARAEGVDEDDIDFFSDGYNLTHGTSPLKSPSKRVRENAATLATADVDDAGSDKENASAPSRNNFHTKSTSHPNLRLYQDQHYRQQKEPRHLQQQQSGQQQQINYIRLESEIANERARREQAEETVDFLKMECQFRCCSCRVAEEKEAKYIFDGSLEEGMELVREEAREAMHLDTGADLDTDMGEGEGEGEGICSAPEGDNDAIAAGKPPLESSISMSAIDSKEDYFSLVPAGEDSRMLDKSGITVDDEINAKQNNANTESAESAESAEARATSLCFSPTSGTFRSASAASASSAGVGSAPSTSAPTADTSFDSDRSNYATPPVSMDRSFNYGRVLPFKPLLDTIPSHPASPHQDRLAAGQGDEQYEQDAEQNETGSVKQERNSQRREAAKHMISSNSNHDDTDVDEAADIRKGTERYYTPAEELDIRVFEDKFGVNGKSKDGSTLATQAHEQEEEEEEEEEQADTDADSLTNSNNNNTTTVDPQTPVQASSSRGRFMLRTVTTTTQVPLHSTPVTNHNHNNNNNSSSSSSKVMTTPHQHFNHDYNLTFNHNHPSTTGPGTHDRRYNHHHHHYHHQPPTPMTAPLPAPSQPLSSLSSTTDTASNNNNNNKHPNPNHHQQHSHTPIDRAAALAQIQARRGRARSLAEGLQQQQQQQHGMNGTGAPVTTATTTTPSAKINANANSNRIMKRDTRDISAPALKGARSGF